MTPKPCGPGRCTACRTSVRFGRGRGGRRAHVLLALGRTEEARRAVNKALERTEDPTVRRFLETTFGAPFE